MQTSTTWFYDTVARRIGWCEKSITAATHLKFYSGLLARIYIAVAYKQVVGVCYPILSLHVCWILAKTCMEKCFDLVPWKLPSQLHARICSHLVSFLRSFLISMVSHCQRGRKKWDIEREREREREKEREREREVWREWVREILHLMSLLWHSSVVQSFSSRWVNWWSMCCCVFPCAVVSFWFAPKCGREAHWRRVDWGGWMD